MTADGRGNSSPPAKQGDRRGTDEIELSEFLTLDDVRAVAVWVQSATAYEIVNRIVLAEVRLEAARRLSGNLSTRHAGELDRYEAHVMRLIEGIVPDALRGRGTVLSAREGGRKRLGWRKNDAVTDDQLRAQVAALVESGESLTNARRRVAEKYGMGLTTVRERTAD